MIRDVHPESRIRIFFHSGSRIQGSKKQWISDPQHCRKDDSTVQYMLNNLSHGDLDTPLQLLKMLSYRGGEGVLLSLLYEVRVVAGLPQLHHDVQQAHLRAGRVYYYVT
jgi:hypothetical protein